MNDADANAIYHSFDAEGGSYSAGAGTMSRIPVFAKDPTKQGREASLQCVVDANTIPLRGDVEQTWHGLE